MKTVNVTKLGGEIGSSGSAVEVGQVAGRDSVSLEAPRGVGASKKWVDRVSGAWTVRLARW